MIKLLCEIKIWVKHQHQCSLFKPPVHSVNMVFWCKNSVLQSFQTLGCLMLALARWQFWLNFSSLGELSFYTKTPQIWQTNSCPPCLPLKKSCYCIHCIQIIQLIRNQSIILYYCTTYASMQDCGTKMYVCARNSMLNFTTDVLQSTSKKTNLFRLFPWKNLFLSLEQKIDYLCLTCIWETLNLRH